MIRRCCPDMGIAIHDGFIKDVNGFAYMPFKGEDWDVDYCPFCGEEIEVSYASKGDRR